jgi:hypothetical protein
MLPNINVKISRDSLKIEIYHFTAMCAFCSLYFNKVFFFFFFKLKKQLLIFHVKNMIFLTRVNKIIAYVAKLPSPIITPPLH